jgi:hypothetical protein
MDDQPQTQYTHMIILAIYISGMVGSALPTSDKFDIRRKSMLQEALYIVDSKRGRHWPLTCPASIQIWIEQDH